MYGSLDLSDSPFVPCKSKELIKINASPAIAIENN